MGCFRLHNTSRAFHGFLALVGGRLERMRLAFDSQLCGWEEAALHARLSHSSVSSFDAGAVKGRSEQTVVANELGTRAAQNPKAAVSSPHQPLALTGPVCSPPVCRSAKIILFFVMFYGFLICLFSAFITWNAVRVGPHYRTPPH